MSNNLPDAFISHIFNNEKTDPIWLGYRIELRRNCIYYPYPRKANSYQKEQLYTLVTDVVQQAQTMKSPLARSFTSLTPQERAFIYEHYFIEPSEEQNGVGIVADIEGTHACLINSDDHLRLVALTNTFEFHATWNRLLQLEKAIEKHLPFAFSAQLGYLASHLGHCGTGFSLTTYIHIPLILQNPDLRNKLLEEELPKELCIAPDSEEASSQIVYIKTKYSLGISEDQMINALTTYATKIKNEEQKLREQKQKNDTLQDALGRAYGLLKHSYRLEPDETKKALSAIKLGLNLGLVSGITDEQINTLLFTLRRAHLSLSAPGNSDIDKARADYLHQAIASIHLPYM